MAKRYWINYLKEYIFTPSVPANDTTSQTGTFKAMVERLQNRMTQEKGVPWYQDAPTTNATAATHIAEDASTAHGGSIQATQKDGTAQTFRATYNFTGPGVTVSDDSTNNRSNVDIPGGTGGGGGSAHIIQEEGASQTARSRLNFRGVGSTASDDSANDRTNVDIRGNVHRSTTAPTSPVTGEQWADSNTTPATARNYTGSAWEAIQAVPTDSSVTDVKVASAAGIAKSKLGPLSVDTPDLAADRSLIITCTSSTRPASPLPGQAIFETDTENVLLNTGSPSVPVWTSITASSAYQATDFISGLMLTWDAANTLGIETGAAYIPGNSAVMEVPTRLTRAVTFPASSTSFHYIYLFSNGGAPDIEISLTAPATPYRGTARNKTGDNTRRYLGAILPNGLATPAMYKWSWQPGDQVMYLQNNQVAPFEVVNNATSTSEVTRSCAAVVPPTCKLAKLNFRHFHTSVVYFGNSEDAVTPTSGEGIFRMSGTDAAAQVNQTDHDMPLDSSQAFTTRWSTAPTGSNGLYVMVTGYYESR